MKKYFFLIILFCNFTAHAQKLGPALETAQLARQVASQSAAQLSQQLERGAQAALEQARAAKIETYPYISHNIAPAVGVQVLSGWQVEPLYQDRPELKKAGDISSYLLRQENSLVVQEMERQKNHVWPQLGSNIKQLEQAAAATPQTDDPLHTVIEKLPSSVNTLFVGELHGFPEIKQAMNRLLVQLRRQQPSRPIILFTEFLPKDFVWKEKNPSFKWHPGCRKVGLENKDFLAVWNQAQELNIPTVGLEPMQSCLDTRLCSSFFSLAGNGVVPKYFNISLSGIKYRNENFVEVLQRYRENNPDALFVVYTGTSHVEYHKFYSVAAQFKPQETFVLSLFPSVKRLAQRLGEDKETAQYSYHPIRQFIQVGDFPQNFLYFNKDLAPIAGVDALIRLETPKE